MKQYLSTMILTAAAAAFAAACGAPTEPNAAYPADHSAHTSAEPAHADGHHTASSPNAAGQPYDLQFLDSMIHHHEGAVSMSEMVLRRSENDELKAFARKVIDDQTKEIAQMKQWREAWFAGKPAAVNMELPGMKESMMTPEHENMMEAASGRAFDDHFVEMMVPHHDGAVKMSRELLQKGERAELKQLAEQIIKAQNAEIEQMRAWQKAWSR